MYFKIKNSLGTAALALIIAMMSSQQAFALLPLDAEAADNNAGTIPNEISLNDNTDDSALLTPPSLNDDTGAQLPLNDDDEAPVPLDNGALAQSGESNQSGELSLPGASDNTAPIDLNNSPLGGAAPAAFPGGNAPAANPVMPGLGFRPQATMPESNNFGEALLSQVDNELFNQMSDIEKQTSLLTLELRREKIKNEIAAIKAARQKAVDDLKEQEQEKERKRIEWEKEQERKLLIEEQKLKALSITLEKLRQESIVNAYKAEMLTTNQKWIDNNTKLYAEIMKGEEDRDNLVKNFKMKLNHLAQMADKAADAAETAKKNYSRELANLQTQISILKSRLEAEKTAREEISNQNRDKANPFASADGTSNAPENKQQKLSDSYAIMEISGQGDELAAKLINKSGSSFMVQKGTVLQSGHTVEEITQTYLRADKKGSKDYLYFAAGGILDREPVKSLKLPTTKGMTPMPQDGDDDDDLAPLPSLNSSQGLPSLREGMFIR